MSHEPSAHSSSADDITREYHADGLVVEWRQGLCIHSGKCVQALPRVFNPRRQPWIETANGSPDEIRQAVNGCPSGALRIRES